jgi:hypothetical protein
MLLYNASNGQLVPYTQELSNQIMIQEAAFKIIMHQKGNTITKHHEKTS